MITIENEAHFWCLCDTQDPRPDAEQMVSIGYMAELLGVDILTVRQMYQDFLQRRGVRCALEARMRNNAAKHPELASNVEQYIADMFDYTPY